MPDDKKGRLAKTRKKLAISIVKRLTSIKLAWASLLGRWPVGPAGDCRPTRVAFLCHMPALWSKLEPVYLEARAAADFETIVISANRDGGVRRETARFLASKGVRVEGPHDEPSTDLESLKPDYVFHSVPYEHFYPDQLKPVTVYKYARLCYVPYMGQLVFAGGVADIIHKPSHFSLVRLAFLADQSEKEALMKSAGKAARLLSIKQVGSPHSDVVYETLGRSSGAKKERLKVLWTPRWNTREGNCHFFEYMELLLGMSERGEFVLTFRPHPLCLSDMLRTGELTKAEHDKFIGRLEACPFAKIDLSGDYLVALGEHDVFVSDISSVLADAALTGKPVIYTHRVDHFNDLGRFIAEGFYWVRDGEELSSRLRALTLGEDPLEGRRREIREDFRRRQPTGAASKILEEIRRDRNER